MRSLVSGLGLLAAAGMLTWLTVPGSPAADAPVEEPPSLHFQGVASCAAAGCHHGNGLPEEKGSEYSTWVTRDLHSRAYQVLLDDTSKAILSRYPQAKQRTHPENEQICLDCHAPREGTVAGVNTSWRKQDGVGCENCHGPAEKYRERHYRQQWKSLNASEKEHQGLRPLNDLSVRIRVCAGCHIGSAIRDVDHALIAAGHPRLRFEYAAYLANMPPHWHDKQSARDWALGQVVSAQAALELLAGRADREEQSWPELAEYDCYACHHDLQSPSWRQERYTKLMQSSKKESPQKPGTLAGNSWYFALLARLTPKDSGDDSWQKGLMDLRRELDGLSSDQKKVSKLARGMAGDLGHLLERVQQAPYGEANYLDQLQQALVKDEVLANSNWDSATQQYLGIAALDQALRRQKAPSSLGDMLTNLTRELGFPEHYQSPRGFKPR
jgi:hypothetical protein